jgi:hypothetical protein
MLSSVRKDMQNETVQEITCFPTWFITITDSPPLSVAFAITVLLCAPLLMVFGALYPLFRH